MREHSMYAMFRRKARKRGKAKGSKKLLHFAFASVVVFLCVVLAQPFKMGGNNSPSKPKAAIIDGLLNYPNQTFVKAARELLSEVGFQVDYIGSESVTVEFYRRLPRLGYSFLIVRVHVGPLFRRLPDGTEISEGTVFFTTEPYDPTRYVGYQENRQLAKAWITGNPDQTYFAVSARFFDLLSPEDKFQNTTVILDSCFAVYLEADEPHLMAEALIRRGAKVFIGWDGEVQASHTDAAVLALLKALCIERLTVKEAVKTVMEEVGRDPYYTTSVLVYYPFNAGDYRLNIQEESY